MLYDSETSSSWTPGRPSPSAAPDATVVAVHMEALDHATVSGADLRAYADA